MTDILPQVRILSTAGPYGSEAIDMNEVTISPKFQIVIPKLVRDRLRFKPGQKLGVLVKGKTVSLVPLRPIEELEGIAEGASMEGYREEDDRY